MPGSCTVMLLWYFVHVCGASMLWHDCVCKTSSMQGIGAADVKAAAVLETQRGHARCGCTAELLLQARQRLCVGAPCMCVGIVLGKAIWRHWLASGRCTMH